MARMSIKRTTAYRHAIANAISGGKHNPKDLNKRGTFLRKQIARVHRAGLAGQMLRNKA